ncbi:MAG: hypothetical protein M5U28_16035 [Sandaracinaceae bacterium]|nr:hypothetical protein [Sandaracinaceae bacterium]
MDPRASSAISLCLLLCAAPASAQPSLEAAERALERDDPRAALELARRARAARPSARSFAALGRAHAALGEPVVAHRFFRRALTLAPRGELGVRLAAWSAEARAGFTVVRLELAPSDASVLVDGATAEWEVDRALHLAPGAHTLEVRAPGHRSARVRVRGRGGEEVTLTVSLIEGSERLPPTELPPWPRPRRPAPAWVAGDLAILGVGLTGAALAIPWAADREAASTPESAGARRERGWAAFQGGLSFGLALGAGAHLAAWALVFDAGEPPAPFVQMALTLAIVAPTLAVGLGWLASSERALSDCERGGASCDAQADDAASAATVTGVLAGAALSTFANVLLGDRHSPAAHGLALLFGQLAMIELMLGFVSAAQAASALQDPALQRYAAELSEGASACAALASDARDGLSRERRLCSSRAASEALAAGSITFGATLALAAIGLVVWGDGGTSGRVAVSAGPGDVRVTGRF